MTPGTPPRPLRYVHIVRTVNPIQGGPIEGVKQLGAAATKLGHHVEVVTLDPPNSAHLREFPLALHAVGPAVSNYGYSPRLVPWLRKNAQDFDAVIVNGIWQYQSYGTWLALRRSATPYFVFTHGQLDPWFKRHFPLKHMKKWTYWLWAEQRVLRDARRVLFTSEEERLLARQSFRQYSASEAVVRYGTKGPNGTPECQTAQLFGRWPELRRKRIITFMGRLHPKKGCDLAIRAFAAQLVGHPEWHLLVCGPDQEGLREQLESLARHLAIGNRVTWTGMVAGDLKWGAMRAAEALFLPSHSENFGIVVAEALACGTPVLISNRVNIWREVEEDGAGFVAEDSLAGASSLLQRWSKQSPDQQAVMRRRAKNCFESRFEVSQAASGLLSLLAKARSHQRSRNGAPIQRGQSH